jgi:TPP-dependent 2-oxoacid decarboxylase
MMLDGILHVLACCSDQKLLLFRCCCCCCCQALEVSIKPVLLGGPRLRARGRAAAFAALADAFKGGVATTADGKGLFPEDHPHFIGEAA